MQLCDSNHITVLSWALNVTENPSNVLHLQTLKLILNGPKNQKLVKLMSYLHVCMNCIDKH